MYAGTYVDDFRERRNAKKQLTQQAAIALAEQFVAEVIQNGLHVRRAILFGSYAKNEQHELSDIDLALVADEFENNRFENNRLIQDIKIKKPYFDIETHTYNTAYFERGDNGFIDEEIKPKGIVIL